MRAGQVAVRDGHPLCPGHGEPPDARPYSSIEPLSRLPKDGCALARGPGGDVFVIAHHGHGERCTGGDDVCRHRADETFPLGFGEDPIEASLRLVEGLDGY